MVSSGLNEMVMNVQCGKTHSLLFWASERKRYSNHPLAEAYFIGKYSEVEE